MGLNGLLISGLNLIKTASSLGIEQSAVRDISEAHASDDVQRINRTFSVFRKWIWITATFGVVLTITLSPLLSRFSFKSGEHTWSFVILSSTFIFGALAGGIYTLLRGTRKIKSLAQANIAGSVIGLVVALPIFYFYGIKGVVPAIVLTSLSGYLVSLYFSRKISFQKVALSYRETIKEGGGMVKLGISLSLSALMGTGVSYVLYAFITRSGSLIDVGLYSAGMTIVGT
jgi:O-antigen/teichoic acid export membrane protein